MNPIKDLTNQRFDRLYVIQRDGSKDGQALWLCQCDCGNLTHVVGWNLRQGRTKSCGCLKLIKATTHGLCVKGQPQSVELNAYHAAKMRCVNPNNPAFNNYGGRGIEFRFDSFEEFLADIGEKPTPQHSLDRINNDGHYEKGNVRWATPKEQVLNSRHANFLTHEGQTLVQQDWAKQLGLAPHALTHRLKSPNWCKVCALTLPKFARCQHR